MASSKRVYVGLCFMLTFSFANIAFAGISWNKTYGLSGVPDYLLSMRQVADGGYIGAFTTNGKILGGSIPSLLKLDAIGNIEWAKTYDGGDNILPNDVMQTMDGGYLVVGTKMDYGDYRGIAFKVNHSGEVQWQRSYKVPGHNNRIFKAMQTSEGGYVLVGTNQVPYSPRFIWALKIDESGDIEWHKTYGNAKSDPFSILMTSEGGYLIAGRDGHILMLNRVGEIQWHKKINCAEWFYVSSIARTDNGCYVLAGGDKSYPWAIKFDSDGELLWQKKYNFGMVNVGIIGTEETGHFLYGGTTNGAGSLIKINLKGESDWHARSRRRMLFHDSTNDKGYVFSYRSINNYVVATDINIVKSDFDLAGCWKEIEARNFGTNVSEGNFIINNMEKSFSVTQIYSNSNAVEMSDINLITETNCISDFPKISIYGSLIDYGIGLVELGDSNASTLLIVNEGGVDLDISNISINGKDTDQFNLTSDCSTVIPGASCVLDVTFAPTSLGEKNALLKIVSNDPAQPVIEIPLSGKGIDTKPPVVSIATDRDMLWPPNHKVVDVLVNGTAADDGSGIASVDITIADEYGTYDSTLPDFGKSVSLEAWRDGNDKDGRVYTLTAVATDKAGNTSTATTQVLVPHDMGK